MGFPLIHCEQGPGLTHAFFDTGAGSNIAFFAFSDGGDFETDLCHMGVPRWVNHALFQVTEEEAHKVREKLAAAGVAVIEADHGWCHAIYCLDPNGVVVGWCIDTKGFVPDAPLARQLLYTAPADLPPGNWGIRRLTEECSTLTKSSLGESSNPEFLPAKGFHHLSFATKNLEATRHFYEDLFGFPMVRCETERWEEGWMKCAFFDIGRGSFIAFFAFENVGECPVWHTNFDTPLGQPKWSTHAAFRATHEEVRSVTSRMEADGIKPLMEMSHGWCFSIYWIDPNGIAVELCVDTPGVEPDRESAKRLWEA